MVPVVFALLTALGNGAASVFQRQAADSVPESAAFHLSLLGYLIRRKVWLAGIAMVIASALCQAIALATGPVTLVQPIFIIELPFSLLLASRLNGRRRLPPLTWAGVALVTVSLGAGLAAAAPSGGSAHAPLRVWIPTLAATAGFEAVLIAVGVRLRGNPRAAALGLAAGLGYGLTAALMKSAMGALARGAVPFLTSWQLYCTALAGVGALFLFQNSLQAGSLVAAQPPLTLGAALSSSAYGVGVFGETIRTGGWLPAEIAAVLLIAAGCVELSRSLAGLRAPRPPVYGPAPPWQAAGNVAGGSSGERQPGAGVAGQGCEADALSRNGRMLFPQPLTGRLPRRETSPRVRGRIGPADRGRHRARLTMYAHLP